MDELISKKTVLDALAEISREVDDGDGFDYAKWREYVCELPPVQFATDTNVGTKLGTDLAEVGKDLISRQAAIDIVFEYAKGLFKHVGTPEDNSMYSYGRGLLLGIERNLKELPPTQPKRGRWIKLDMHRGMADHKCSVCKQECYVPTCMGEPMYAFCPNCGADMRGEQDE